MVTTTTAAGRAQLAHPDLGHDGGSGLWNKVHTMFQKISDSLAVQYFGEYTVSNGNSQDVVHNFDMNITELDVRIIESDVVISQEQQSVYSIGEKSGNEKNALTITNNSGGSKTFAVYVMGFSLDKLLGRLKRYTTTTNATQTNILSIPIATNESMALTILVSARKDGTNANFYKIEALAENNSGTASVRIVSKVYDEDVSAYDCTVGVNGGNVEVLATGELATTVEWSVVVQKSYF